MSEQCPRNETVASVVENGLCAQCGFCEAVCPTRAISMRTDADSGEIWPEIHQDACTMCALCLSVCPGEGMDFDRYYKSYLSVSSYKKYLGYIRRAYIGYSTDMGHRCGAASGGVLSELAAFALESGMTDYIIFSTPRTDDPFRTRTVITDRPEQVRRACGSIYYPVPLGQGLAQLMENNIPENARLGIIGLPCHIHAAHKLSDIRRFRKYQWHLIFGIFCGGTWSYRATDAFLHEVGEDKENISSFSYRGKGWPGKISWTRHDGTSQEIHRHQLGLMKKMMLASVFSAKSFHTPHRCFTCSDGLAELSDIAFGDPWLKSEKGDVHGKTLIVVRTSKAHELLNRAVSAGVVSIREISREDVIVAQKGMLIYKQNFQAFNTAVKRLGQKRVPRYNYAWRESDKTPVSIKLYAVLAYITFLLGKHITSRWLRIFLMTVQSVFGRIIKKYIIHLTDKDHDNYFS